MRSYRQTEPHFIHLVFTVNGAAEPQRSKPLTLEGLQIKPASPHTFSVTADQNQSAEASLCTDASSYKGLWFREVFKADGTWAQGLDRNFVKKENAVD